MSGSDFHTGKQGAEGDETARGRRYLDSQYSSSTFHKSTGSMTAGLKLINLFLTPTSTCGLTRKINGSFAASNSCTRSNCFLRFSNDNSISCLLIRSSISPSHGVAGLLRWRFQRCVSPFDSHTLLSALGSVSPLPKPRIQA